MNYLDTMWVLIYLFNMLLLSFGLGCFTFSQPRWLLISGLPRFLLGFCMAPYAMGAITLALTATYPAAPRWLYVMAPSVVSIALIITYLPRSYKDNKEVVLQGLLHLLSDLTKKSSVIVSLIVCIASSVAYALSIILAARFLNYLRQTFEQAYSGTGYLWLGSLISFSFPLGFYINVITDKYYQIQTMLLVFTIAAVILCLTLLILKVSTRYISFPKQTGYYSAVPFRPEKWIYLNAIVLLLALSLIMICNISVPIIDADAREYMAKGLLIAETHTLPISFDFSGMPVDTLRNDAHGLMFPAYLSQALMTNGDHPLGYPFDYSARAAFQITFIYMLLSLVALTTVFRPSKESAFALLLLLQTPYYFSIITNSYRDAFRLIPLILLSSVLMGLSPENLRGRKFYPLTLLFPMSLAAASLYGHTLNGFVVVCILLAWLVWGTLGKTYWLNRLWITGAVGLGLLIGGIRYIVVYFKTGLILGYLSGPPGGYLFGPSGSNIPSEAYQGITSISASRGFLGLLERDHFLLSVPGLLSAVFFVGLWIFMSKRRNELSAPLFVSLIVISNLLPLLGAFDIKSYKLSEAFLINYRYLLYWHPFAAICVSTIAWEFNKKMKMQSGRWIKNITVIVLTLVSSIAVLSAHIDLWSRWARNNSDALLITSIFGPMLKAETLLSGEQRLLLNITGDNYYLDNRAISMYTKPTWGAVYANSDENVKRTLHDLNIGAVVFYDDWISTTWINHPLFQFLEKPENAYLFSRDEYSRVYILNNKNTQAVNLDDIRKSILWQLETPLFDSNDRHSIFIGPETNFNVPPLAIQLSEGTITMWVSKTNMTDMRVLPLIQVNTDDLLIYSIARNDANFVCVDYDSIFLGCGPEQKEDNQSHNYTFTWKDGEQAFYVDGVLAIYGRQPSVNAVSQSFKLGYDDQNETFWNGYIADLTTFERSLSSVEVNNLIKEENMTYARPEGTWLKGPPRKENN